MSKTRGWLVTRSCNWTREAWSRWAAESMAKLHPRLSASGTDHTITIEEPPNPEALGQSDPPLT